MDYKVPHTTLRQIKPLFTKFLPLPSHGEAVFLQKRRVLAASLRRCNKKPYFLFLFVKDFKFVVFH